MRREVLGEVEDVRFDEDERWLSFRRGRHWLACNFAAQPRDVPVGGGALVLATDAGAQVREGSVRLQPLSGALLT